ncbi:MAG TPA: DUF2267 domain-containing protein, partial [Methylocystis sp.]|nr:DUF2267 domain-containing protein [Methylocystis sp.]
MEELIRKISESIGVDESVATAAVGHVLAFLQKELPEGPVSELVAKLPGSQEAIAAAETAPVEGLGAALGGLGGLIGGATGDIMGLVGNLGSIG